MHTHTQTHTRSTHAQAHTNYSKLLRPAGAHIWIGSCSQCRPHAGPGMCCTSQVLAGNPHLPPLSDHTRCIRFADAICSLALTPPSCRWQCARTQRPSMLGCHLKPRLCCSKEGVEWLHKLPCAYIASLGHCAHLLQSPRAYPPRRTGDTSTHLLSGGPRALCLYLLPNVKA